MYYADSDILSILLAIITVAAGIYSSSSKRKKGGECIEEQPILEDDDLSFDSIFEGMVEVEQTQEQTQEHMQEQNVVQIEDVPQEILHDEGIQTTVTEIQGPVSQEENSSVKSRLKSSPKDAVLFAEILKPKYKEF